MKLFTNNKCFITESLKYVNILRAYFKNQCIRVQSEELNHLEVFIDVIWNLSQGFNLTQLWECGEQRQAGHRENGLKPVSAFVPSDIDGMVCPAGEADTIPQGAKCLAQKMKKTEGLFRGQ